MASSATIRKILLKRHEIDHLSWRYISGEIGVNVGHVYNFAVHGIEPINPEIRLKLGLPRKCPVCKNTLRTVLPKSQGDEVMYQQIIADMPAGLERLIMQILSRKIGKEMTMKRVDLLSFIQSIPGFSETEDRQMRKAINTLRKEGHLICSRTNYEIIDGKKKAVPGYHMAASLEEYKEFADQEFRSKISDMADSLRSMDESAKRQFGDSFQMNLV